jgi:hypothetical protein
VIDDLMTKLRTVLREQLAKPQESLEPVRTALAELAEAARSMAIPSEQFVILVKQEWNHLLEAEAVQVSDPIHQRLRRSVVTAAIKAYYMQ